MVSQEGKQMFAYNCVVIQSLFMDQLLNVQLPLAELTGILDRFFTGLANTTFRLFYRGGGLEVVVSHKTAAKKQQA